MEKVFLSGSRSISRLNDDIRSRVQCVIDKDFNVIIGDANGADKALQQFLYERHYSNVTVFCAGASCRNNIGSWNVHTVDVDAHLKGRDFYTAKDKVMARHADYGLVLWDGKSAGSIANVLELLENEKYSVVYFAPEKKFYNIKTVEDAQALLRICDKDAIHTIKKKVNVSSVYQPLDFSQQQAFSF